MTHSHALVMVTRDFEEERREREKNGISEQTIAPGDRAKCNIPEFSGLQLLFSHGEKKGKKRRRRRQATAGNLWRSP